MVGENNANKTKFASNGRGRKSSRSIWTNWRSTSARSLLTIFWVQWTAPIPLKILKTFWAIWPKHFLLKIRKFLLSSFLLNHLFEFLAGRCPSVISDCLMVSGEKGLRGYILYSQWLKNLSSSMATHTFSSIPLLEHKSLESICV